MRNLFKKKESTDGQFNTKLINNVPPKTETGMHFYWYVAWLVRSFLSEASCWRKCLYVIQKQAISIMNGWILLIILAHFPRDPGDKKLIFFHWIWFFGGAIHSIQCQETIVPDGAEIRMGTVLIRSSCVSTDTQPQPKPNPNPNWYKKYITPISNKNHHHTPKTSKFWSEQPRTHA